MHFHSEIQYELLFYLHDNWKMTVLSVMGINIHVALTDLQKSFHFFLSTDLVLYIPCLIRDVSLSYFNK